MRVGIDMERYECKAVAVAGGPEQAAAGEMIRAILRRHFGKRPQPEVTLLTEESLAGMDSDCVLVVNADEDALSGLGKQAHPYRILRAGTAADADFRVSEIEELGSQGIRFNLTTGEGTTPLRLAMQGAKNAVDAALAAAAATAAGVAWEEIISGLSHMEPSGGLAKTPAGSNK